MYSKKSRPSWEWESCFWPTRAKKRILNKQMSAFETEYGKGWYSGDKDVEPVEVELKNARNELRILHVSYLSLFETRDVIIAHDITERTRAQKILQESEERFRNITQSANDAIITIDITGTIVSWNKAATRIFGYSEAEALGSPLTRLIPPKDRKAHEAGMEQVRTDPRYRVTQETLELKGLHKNGTFFYIELSMSTWAMEGARYITGILRDITQRKEQEAQLIQAHKLEVVGQLTDGIAHDFNNLLTIILGNLRLLREEANDDAYETIRELIEDSLSAAHDGAELCRRLLKFSRKQSIQPKQIDGNEFLNGLKRFIPRIVGEHITFRILGAENISALFADPARLENAILNLIVNARDAMPEGGTLTVETVRRHIVPHNTDEYPVPKPGTYTMITVSDTGIGMPADDTVRAVEPFYTTKEVGKGSGLGLSMVYDFTKQSGGGLRISSELGKGTSVSILLPESDPNVHDDYDHKAPEVLPRGSETVLVVEDGNRLRKLAKRSLESLGYQVLEAENAAEAVKILSVEPTTDLLFSDIVMPGSMNGRELATWALTNRPGLKILLTTGFDKDGNSKNLLNIGDIPLLEKPYTKEQLATKVRAVLDAEKVVGNRASFIIPQK